MKTYDVVVIGTGTAGQTAAFEISDHGYTVAVIEHSSEPGGVCALHGCQSKKYFYEATECVAKCRHLSGKGFTRLPEASWRAIANEKNKFTAPIPEDTIKNLKGSGVDFYKGTAFFTGQTTLAAGDQEIQGRFIIIASGAEPMALPIKGAEHIITSNDFLALEDLPGRIAFVGGGFISFEFAHFAARLGSKPGHVHILEAQEKVLGPFDSDMVQQLTAASKKDGIIIETGVNILEIIKKNHQFQVVSESGGVLEVDLVVNGAGRRPAIQFLNLETADIAYSGTGIQVDQTLRTSNKHVFAVGDCAASIQLARIADMEAKTAARAILNQLEGIPFKPMDYSVVPTILFTYPQLGMVGKTEEQLQQEKIQYWKSVDTQLRWPSYRRIGMEHAAFKILVDENEQVLGAHFLSDNTTGLVNTFAQAMRAGTRVSEVYENSILSPYPSRESDILYMLSALLE
jgi:glutathione reductase (NADPH)